MRSVSQKFIDASLSPVGYATAYIQIGSTTIDASNITEISIASNLGGGAFTIGGFDTTEATITVVSDALPNVITAQPISVYFGYYVNNGNVAYEYVPMGVFYAEPRDVTHKNLLTTIKAHDRSWAMTDPYTTSLNFSGNVKVSQVLSEIATALSLTMGSYGGLAPANVRVYEAPQGSYRDVIAQMALLMGTNAKLNRTGALDFIKINPSASPVQEYGAYDYNAENYELTSDAPMAFGVLTVNYTHEVVTGSGEDQETVKYPPLNAKAQWTDSGLSYITPMAEHLLAARCGNRIAFYETDQYVRISFNGKDTFVSRELADTFRIKTI